MGEAVLTSTHNLCFLSRNKKINVDPYKSKFYCIKVGFKGVKTIKACFCDAKRRDEEIIMTKQTPPMKPTTHQQRRPAIEETPLEWSRDKKKKKKQKKKTKKKNR